MTARSNPCKAARAGCTRDPEPGKVSCRACRMAQARSATERRARLLAARACTVCGAAAALGPDGHPLGTCTEHREYYRARAEASRATGREPEPALP